MEELELVGLHEDGEHLVLARPDGGRFRVRIDEPLRAAVRRDRPQLEQLRAEGAGTLSPREIQARIRAGATTQEVADQSGLSVEHVRRYEGPVLAEREYVAEQARGTRIGKDSGAPTLGDLVTDRLAARGVDVGSLAWDAARDAAGPWVVLARFSTGDAQHEARWIFDQSARSVTADEDEARWLSETEIADEPVARRHLAAVRDVVFDFQTTVDAAAPPPPAEPEPEPAADTHALLDDLRSRRGVRQALDVEDDGEADEFEGFGPQHAFDFSRLEASVPGAHPADADDDAEAVVVEPPVRPTYISALPAAPAGDPEAQPALAPAPAAEADAPAAVGDDTDRPRTRRGRAKVPSWDEIVFGARPE
ncbi:septation protein SepH [Cellulomonas edaphi]|uniref:Septation protein SepH n=1 Tax=Cellulomonas edaphi TaxID=3053468 RepID=A0ABT7S6Y7_9CELL|nr:septation protein SepH [Cellulomons edaphi]MDM7831380.1 septation protein SepH [Cellulomons edaphi]